jgi:hypothetical protein
MDAFLSMNIVKEWNEWKEWNYEEFDQTGISPSQRDRRRSELPQRDRFVQMPGMPPPVLPFHPLQHPMSQPSNTSDFTCSAPTAPRSPVAQFPVTDKTAPSLRPHSQSRTEAIQRETESVKPRPVSMELNHGK